MNFPMGLDKEFVKCLNGNVNVKSLLQALGLGKLARDKSSRVSPIVRERERFEAEVREQFKKLKEKGISIPVFTL
ncbi:MAG: hypothetical protein UX31_C0038G0003 [Candidatus Nomurabacteria bacterium GW2011_GWA1_46_11]|uniref:Uncharacterized protein n=2 Tax=Patescibacteria group TaxID=1783273 RepID=A0A0G1WB33_9BACT|nr:MAG: hypothetical protein UX31_C0038G0003 [Candidatus Nomurabacteria bacterium GW2011_GWA1_46_11]KKU87533.1 MAG: hypothetical protein UY16_C0025G0011 [Candidatus Gottesmanbacteria bacterium GW2011_GWA2_47_9]